MIKTRQKNIRIFEFSGGTSCEYIDFITKNFVLLKDYLLVFKTNIDSNLIETLDKLKILYIVSEAELRGKEVESSKIHTSDETTTEIYRRNIRSGEEVQSSKALIFLGNINNGARIVSDIGISIFGKCEGIVVCEGEYLILRNISSGYIVFCGEILSEQIIEKINSNDYFKIITKNGDNISIKELQ